MRYLRELRNDAGRMLGAESDLILIALVAALGLTVQRYHLPALARRLVALVTPALEPSIAAGLQPLVAKLAGAFLLAGTGLAATAAMRRPVREFGLGVGLPRRWLVDTGISFAVLLPLIAWAASLPSFRHSYPYFAVMRVSAGWFAAGLTVRLAYMFAWEFLFRGLILFGFERRAGPAAGIAASTLPFVLMHFGKPGIEVYSSAAAGVVLGIIALRGRSFLPCWLLHFAAAATLDLLTLAR